MESEEDSNEEEEEEDGEIIPRTCMVIKFYFQAPGAYSSYAARPVIHISCSW